MNRTPKQTTQKIKRKPRGMRQTHLYQKVMKISISGYSPDEIEATAHEIHKVSAPHSTGGKGKRKVTITTLNSTEPTKVFDGKI